MKKQVFYLFYIIFLIGSCSNEDSCVDDTMLNINFPEARRTDPGILFESEEILIEAPEFITPNWDGFSDVFYVFVENKIDDSNLVNSSSLTISNKCEQLFFSDTIEVVWDGDGNKNGIYLVEAFIELTTGEIFEFDFSFEIHND